MIERTEPSLVQMVIVLVAVMSVWTFIWGYVALAAFRNSIPAAAFFAFCIWFIPIALGVIRYTSPVRYRGTSGE